MGTELLIPFIASVLITILLRRLDKSNYRLSQIKRYTQKLTEDINYVAISKIQSVRDAGIDLEIMNKQAKKLSEEIQKVSSDTKVLLETVKSNKYYLDNVSTELSGVVELTGEIQKESAYIQNGLALFQNQRNEIEKIEKEILKVQSEASGILLAFHEKVNFRTDEVLQSLATKIVEMESLLEAKSAKLDEFASNVSVSFQEKLKEEVEILARESVGKVELLHSKVSSLTDSLRESEKSIDSKIIQFRDFSDMVAEKIERVDVRLADKFETAEKKIEDRFIIFEKKIQERFDSIVEQVTQSKEAFIRGLKMEIDAIRREVEGLDLETMTRR
ncbi:MAG: chromosome segregation protein SMC, partial [Leptospiraceae bacterium]|nr:chromosome segregation protein SMC [Leptospiraceae bacterium]